MYCLAPFTHMHLSLSGDVNLCYGTCWTSRPLANILRMDLLDIWRSQEAKDFRGSIIDQSFRYCTDCRAPELLESGKSPEEADLNTIDCLVLAYDRTCNLTCPSCRTGVESPSATTMAIHKALCESKIWPHLKVLTSSGSGESLASPFFWDLLKRLEAFPPELVPRLRLSTNGLLVTPHNLDKIRKVVKTIDILDISIDAACEETYVVNRRGGNWKTLMNNLEFIATTGIPLRTNFVVQANNFLEMPAFVEMALRFGSGYIRFDALSNWTVADEDYRKLAVHLSGHPQHAELKKVLRNPIFSDPRIHLAKLSDEFFASQDPLKTIQLRLAKEQASLSPPSASSGG